MKSVEIDEADSEHGNAKHLLLKRCAGIQKLDEFSTNILVQLVYSPPDTVTEDALYARYRDMKWLQDDLRSVRPLAV